MLIKGSLSGDIRYHDLHTSSMNFVTSYTNRVATRHHIDKLTSERVRTLLMNENIEAVLGRVLFELIICDDLAHCESLR